MGGQASPRRRKVGLAGHRGRLRRSLASWTTRLGYELVETSGEAADLWVVGAPEAIVEGAANVVVAARRLEPELRQALRQRGVCVLEGHHGLLDLAFAFAEGLFASRAEQRRHGLAFGQLEAHVVAADGEPTPTTRGRLVGVNRCGAWVEMAPAALVSSPVVHLVFPFEDRVLRLQGRVVGRQPSPWAESSSVLVGLELVLEHCRGCPGFRGLARNRNAVPWTTV